MTLLGTWFARAPSLSGDHAGPVDHLAARHLLLYRRSRVAGLVALGFGWPSPATSRPQPGAAA